MKFCDFTVFETLNCFGKILLIPQCTTAFLTAFVIGYLCSILMRGTNQSGAFNFKGQFIPALELFYKVSNWLNRWYILFLTNQQVVLMIFVWLNLLWNTWSDCEIKSFLNLRSNRERFTGNRQSAGYIDLPTIDYRLAHQWLVCSQDNVADLIDFSIFSHDNDAALIDFAQLRHINL